MQFTKHNLPNNSKLILIPQKSTKVFAVLVLFKVGSRYETPDTNGISHYIEHLMFKGTTKRPNTAAISRELDGYGAEFNAFTSKDYTGYYVKINAERREKALDILSDMLHNSKFDEKELNRERNVIIEEIHMYRDNPMMHIEDMIEEEVFDNSPLGWSIAGDEKSMAKIGRKEIVNYFKTHYIPQNAVVIFSGNMEGCDPVTLAKKYFNNVKAKNNPPTEFEATLKPFTSGIKIDYKETGQIQLALGFPALKYKDPMMPALGLLSNILGETMSSRLFIKIRERRGLAYYVRSMISPYQDTGAFIIRAGLNKENLQVAIKTILAELKAVKAKGVTAQEIERARENIEGGLVLELEDASSVAAWYGKQELLTGEILDTEKYMAKLNKVTKNDIINVANKIFDLDKLNVALIGPMKDEEKIRKMIK
ncbi:MAG: pitrilysin family protein [Patescibacteria group bacterium]